ncbi:hypothetical protein GCM10023185_42720 [Hymenobacter saemangeumensis]|uniref:Uncharacterized protein n=1 Tax=Hymenobacter saemangeumensis TaxID=1084522 RepID=A0ABP8IS73_9BACT
MIGIKGAEIRNEIPRYGSSALYPILQTTISVTSNQKQETSNPKE